jgi:hypothetical protein
VLRFQYTLSLFSAFAFGNKDVFLSLQIIGSRNPLNVIKALFIALNAVCDYFYKYLPPPDLFILCNTY